MIAVQALKSQGALRIEYVMDRWKDWFAKTPEIFVVDVLVLGSTHFGSPIVDYKKTDEAHEKLEILRRQQGSRDHKNAYVPHPQKFYDSTCILPDDSFISCLAIADYVLTRRYHYKWPFISKFGRSVSESLEDVRALVDELRVKSSFAVLDQVNVWEKSWKRGW